MLELLNNSWVAGIGTGLLSGLLVTWITNRLLSGRSDRELASNISAANREILYTLRNEVSESEMTGLEVVEALINATARKHLIEVRQLLNPKQVCEELIKEVMDSSFISSPTKKVLCASLVTLMPRDETALDRQVQKENGLFVARVEFRERMMFAFSLVLGVLTALITIYQFFIVPLGQSLIGSSIRSAFPMLLVVIFAVLSVNLGTALMEARHRRLRREMGIPPKDVPKV